MVHSSPSLFLSLSLVYSQFSFPSRDSGLLVLFFFFFSLPLLLESSPREKRHNPLTRLQICTGIMLTFESLLPSKGTTGSRDFGNSFQFPLPSIYYHLFPYNIFNEQDIVFRFVDRIETIFIRRNLIHLRIFREDSSKKSSNILVTFPHSSYPSMDHCSRERQTSSRAISSIPVYTKSFQF